MPEGLIIEDLHLSLRAPAGGSSGPPARPVLSGVGLTVAPGEFVALVGASGSGKTMTALSVLGLLPPQIHVESGSIRLGGTDLRAASDAELNRVRGGRIGMLYQQPKRMFNPRKTIGSHLAEPLKLHRGLRGRQARTQALDLLGRRRVRGPGRVRPGLSAPAVRRHGPAGHARRGHGRAARAAARRRADLRPGQGAGAADPGTDRPAAAPATGWASSTSRTTWPPSPRSPTAWW